MPKTSPGEEAADMVYHFKKVNNLFFTEINQIKFVCRESVIGTSHNGTDVWCFKLMHSLKRLYYILYFQYTIMRADEYYKHKEPATILFQ